MKKLSKDQRGFSLLELLVAVSILAVGLLAAVSMQGVALNSNALSHKIATTSMIAQQVMEDLYSWPRNDARLKDAGMTNYEFNQIPGRPRDVLIEGSGTYGATYTIAPNTPVQSVSRITVTITRTSDNAGALALGPLVSLSSRGQNLTTILTSFKRTV